MKSLRRNYVAGGTYFFTVVTHERRPILVGPLARRYLRAAITTEQHRSPFEQVALVLLPDHLHAVWTLPGRDADYSTRLRRIKERFTRAYLRSGGTEGTLTVNRLRHQERGIWQHRFWEHTVRDDDDLKRCTDYIHWNPDKHGLVTRAGEYRWSSFGRFVAAGEYEPGWGTGDTVIPDVPGAEWE